MKALDTNVIVRFLVRDDEEQADTVYRLLKNAEKRKEVLWIPLLVVLETIWVLTSVYNISRHNILDAFAEMMLVPVFKFEAQTTVQQFLISARKSGLDLPDLLIASAARHSGCDAVLTFDRKASQHELFEPLL